MMSKIYMKNTNATLYDLNSAANKAYTNRKFENATEDPYSAAKAYQLRREYNQNQNYQSNVTTLQNMLQTGESSVTEINKILQQTASTDVLSGINGGMDSDARSIVAGKLRTMRAALVSTMNVKFGSTYLFGGSDTTSVPFSVDASGNLLYRGINIDTGENTRGAITAVNNTQICFGAANADKFNGYSLTIEQGTGSGSGVDSLNVVGNNIAITLNSDGATNQQLQDALQNNLANAFTTVMRQLTCRLPL